MSPRFEPTIGRYLHLDLLGRPHRLYVEEAGPGIPLLCLHTAGSDGRQYRGLLNDERITKNFRVIVFDMPWHGKSSPPVGWENEEYRLTSRDYVRMILEVSAALELDRPVVMGCSIGGRIVLHLAHEHPEKFRAIVGLESSPKVDPYYDTSWLHRPDVHGGEVCAGIVSGLVAPTAPDEGRWETLWHYMQSGPGVFKGDLYFYMIDGDISDKLDHIDARRCPLYLLTGEYDYSCTTEGTLEVARRTGAQATIMKDLGHFPMSENPEKFIGYLLPVLEEIRAGKKASAAYENYLHPWLHRPRRHGRADVPQPRDQDKAAGIRHRPEARAGRTPRRERIEGLCVGRRGGAARPICIFLSLHSPKAVEEVCATIADAKGRTHTIVGHEHHAGETHQARCTRGLPRTASRSSTRRSPGMRARAHAGTLSIMVGAHAGNLRGRAAAPRSHGRGDPLRRGQLRPGREGAEQHGGVHDGERARRGDHHRPRAPASTRSCCSRPCRRAPPTARCCAPEG